MPTDTQASQFLTTAQLCARWQCTEETLKNYQRSGRVHPVRPGHKWLYPLSEVEQLESDSRSTTEANK